jgi:predicted RND superfamily exporter protein
VLPDDSSSNARASRFSRRRQLPEWVVSTAFANPRATLASWAFILVLAGLGALGLRVDTSTDSLLDRENPAYAFHLYSQSLFGGEEMLVVAVSSETPWDPESLAEVVRLSDLFEELGQVRRVDSLRTMPLISVGEGGELDLDPPLVGGVPTTAVGLESLASRVLADRIASRNLVSDDGRVFAINLVLEAGTNDGFLEMVEAVRAEVDPERTAITGVPVFRTEINTRTEEELLAFVPLTVVLMAGLLFFLFRSAYAIVLCLSCGLIGAGVMLGSMGAMGGAITLITMILPSIVLALGVAYAMHMLTAAQGQDELEDLRSALRRVSLPVALSGLTTAIGFASIAAVRIDLVRQAGGYGALGVLITLAVTLTLLPACLALRRLPSLRPRFASSLEGRVSEVLTRFAIQRRGVTLVAWALLTLPLCVGLLKLDVATDATSWFPQGTRPRDDYDQIRRSLSGISPVNVVVEAKDGGSVTDPAVVTAIDRLATHLENRPNVGKSISLADPLRQIHGGFIGDSTLPIPDRQDLIEQYLLLLESVESIDDVVTNDRSAANIVLRVDDNRSGSLRAVALDAEDWWRDQGPPGFEARSTGTMFEFARAEDEMTFGQIRGLSLAIVVIGVVLWAVFGRLSLATLALVPNAAPVLAIFGFMGFAGIALDAGTVMVGSLALGIAVDDTMHMITSLHEGHERGLESEASLIAALRTNLPALTFTSLVIALGFGILGLSNFTFIRNLGLLIAALMGVCLLADISLLPALIRRRPTQLPAKSP